MATWRGVSDHVVVEGEFIFIIVSVWYEAVVVGLFLWLSLPLSLSLADIRDAGRGVSV